MRQNGSDMQKDGDPEGKRSDDASVDRKRFFRAGDRYFQIDGQWYFAAREGDQGPYRSRETAVVAAQRFIRGRVATAEAGRRKRPPVVRRGGEPLHRHVLPLEQPVRDRFFLPLDD